MEINTELTPTPHSERNHGIELLRIFAMLLAAVLHILKKGGVITASEGNLAAYSTVWLLEAAAYCAVNCYALISGYVGYSDRPKPLRLARCIELWLQVVFYSVIITTVYCIAGVGSVGVSDFADAFLPVTSKQYWYFTAYIGMFFFIPLLNALVRRLNRRALVSLCIMLIAVFSLYDTFASFWKKDPLALVGGHSPLWLGVLYIFGAAMKKLRVPESMSSKKALLIYASAAVFTALFKITGDRLLRFVPGSLFVRDTSPTVLLCAAALFALQLLPERRAALAAAGLVCAALLTASITETNIMSAQGESSYATYNQNATINSVGTAEYLIDGASSYEAIWAQPKPASDDLHLVSYEKREGVAYVSVENDGGEAAISLPIYNYGNYYAADESGTPFAITSGENMRIVLTVPAGYTGTIHVRYHAPGYWRAFEALSAVSLLGVIGCGAFVRRKRRTPATV